MDSFNKVSIIQNYSFGLQSKMLQIWYYAIHKMQFKLVEF